MSCGIANPRLSPAHPLTNGQQWMVGAMNKMICCVPRIETVGKNLFPFTSFRSGDHAHCCLRKGLLEVVQYLGADIVCKVFLGMTGAQRGEEAVDGRGWCGQAL